MSPFTHAFSGYVVAQGAYVLAPEIFERWGDGCFLLQAIIVGNIPDIDVFSDFLNRKLGLNRVWLKHRYFTHNIFAHLLFSALSAYILVGSGTAFFAAFIYAFIQIGVHLIEDSLDGSNGIYYLIPFCWKPLKIIALMNNVDEHLFKWCPNKSPKCLIKRVKLEFYANLPNFLAAILIWFFKQFDL